jgi:hypothetical protein
MTDLGRGERDAADGRWRDRSSVWAPPVPIRTATCADEHSLVTREREQKPEQHLEIVIDHELNDVSAHAALMLDTARRFTEAASDLPAKRLTNLQGLSAVQPLNRNASDVLALVSCSDR